MHTKHTLFILLLIGLTCTGMSYAHQSHTWTPCECDNQEYTLTLREIPATCPGTFKRSPDKPTYKKGETVYVQYTPAEDRILQRWVSSRPSHFSIEDNGEITALFITGDTTLTAWTIPEKVHLWVNWNENFGDVTLPPGADPFHSSFTVYVDYNDTITLTATPGGNNVMTYWEYRNVRRYGNEITLKPREDLNIEVGFQSSIPPSSINVVTPSGYADVFCTGLYANSAIGYVPLGYTIEPKHGYVLQYVRWQENGQTHYTTSTLPGGGPAGTYTAQMSKWITLNLETEGQGVVTSPEYVGFKPGWNPQPYQTDGTTLSPSIHSGLLIMQPDACPGWVFDHWEYKDASGQWVTANLQSTGNNLAVNMNWWTCPDDGIWHLHVPNGDYTFDAKAVFVEEAVYIEEPNHYPVTDNHFFYNSDTPGVCNVNVHSSDAPCGVSWTLEQIAGATQTSDPSPPNQEYVTFLYTTLPSANHQFGNKLLTLLDAEGATLQQTEIQIFFPEEGWNHPALTTQEQTDMLPPGYTGNVPNWFYYWRQTSANFGSPKIGSSSTFNFDETTGQWYAVVGGTANEVYRFPNHRPVYDYNGTTELTDIAWALNGIDTFAFCARHEACHVEDFTGWWPNGYTTDPNDPRYQEDADGDRIPDALEAGYNYDPAERDSNGDFHEDTQDLCLREQLTIGSTYYWEEGAADAEDWASPGKQCHE